MLMTAKPAACFAPPALPPALPTACFAALA
jgi:hypothetical protein